MGNANMVSHVQINSHMETLGKLSPTNKTYQESGGDTSYQAKRRRIHGGLYGKIQSRNPGCGRADGMTWKISDSCHGVEVIIEMGLQSFLQGEVTAFSHREEDGTKGPMIIEAEIGGHLVHRMYVDGGASSEVLYEHCFVRLQLEIRSQMIPATTSLIGFSGETIWQIGQISLLVRIGDEEHSTSAWMNFMVIRSPSQHNGIIGRTGIRKICAIPSTAHGMLKFPVLEEKIKVVIHPEYPEQTIAIGSILTEKRRKELCALLRQNLDIFSWKPADMTGVPRYMAEHRLNVREGCPPIRQKKRGQAPERNKAIQKEVEKLVDAGIMKEVHYHSWLSNPVMVKKHNGSWRMCVDFKDLNKACPHDGYPLLEIDWKVESLCGSWRTCDSDSI
ncbi:reverse transcriptase domain-containing protein [Tanacetum coccineum]